MCCSTTCQRCRTTSCILTRAYRCFVYTTSITPCKVYTYCQYVVAMWLAVVPAAQPPPPVLLSSSARELTSAITTTIHIQHSTMPAAATSERIFFFEVTRSPWSHKNPVVLHTRSSWYRLPGRTTVFQGPTERKGTIRRGGTA